MKAKPPKACPMAEMKDKPCVHTVCQDCLAVRLKDYNKKTKQQKEDSLLRKEMMAKNKKTCNHDNPYAMVSIDKRYVVGDYADRIRRQKEDNYLPTHCADCKGKYIYIKARKKRSQTTKQNKVASKKIRRRKSQKTI